MNKVVLIGNLTRDPELMASDQGVSRCRFGIAVNRRFSQNDEVDFFNVIAWRAQAENCAKFLKKGKKVAVFGSVQIRKYEKDGQERQAVEISADEVEFLSPRDSYDDGYTGGSGGGGGGYNNNNYNNNSGGGGYNNNYSNQSQGGGGFKKREVSELEPVDDDLPF